MGFKEIVDVLLKHGAYVFDKINGNSKADALSLALEYKRFEIAESLLDFRKRCLENLESRYIFL